jgi:hypothetical protein
MHQGGPVALQAAAKGLWGGLWAAAQLLAAACLGPSAASQPCRAPLALCDC